MVRKPVIFSLIILLGGFFLFSSISFAEEEKIDLRVFDEDLNMKFELDLVPDDFSGTIRFQVGNFQEDTEREIVVSYGNIAKPELVVYDFAGKELRRWQPYVPGFTGEISLAIADFDGDGLDEIVTSPGAGGGPQIRVFDGMGEPKFTNAFWAHSQDYRKGTEVATGDINGDGQIEILASVIDADQALIKYFTPTGQEVENSIGIDIGNSFEPVKLAVMDLGSDGTQEIVVGLGSGNQPKIKLLRRDGSMIKEFLAYGEAFGGGVNFAVSKLPDYNLIATGAGFSGGPHVRFFDSYGKLMKNPVFFAYENSFRGGTNVEIVDLDGDEKVEFITMPWQINNSNGKYLHKYIDVDISEQRLSYYQNGKLVDGYTISSGRYDMPTPLGEYTIFQKNPRAYSNKYELYMPFWMSFKPSYGFHELPEWPSGHKEGQNHLGQRVSHGCVRLGVGPAEKLYNWTPFGTKVFIHE
jgi:hypothetical protein